MAETSDFRSSTNVLVITHLKVENGTRLNRLRFNLNGKWVEEANLSPTTTLLRYLRDTKSLTGTKEGCAEGDCGACTVAVSEQAPDGSLQWRAVNSCLLLLPMIQGKSVITVEALKNSDGTYHPAQEAMARALGSQCGYCTPGIVMSLFEATYRPELREGGWKLDDQLCGNLCRCTGYRPIRSAAEKVMGQCPSDRHAESLRLIERESMELQLERDGQAFFTPVRLGALWDMLEMMPDARFIAGGTDLSLEVTKRFQKLPQVISLEGLAELRGVVETETGYRIGATTVLSDLETYFQDRLKPLARMLRYFGARQIKHRGTLGGNLCNASPIGDLGPVLMSLGATCVLISRDVERRLPLEDFFVGYRKTALRTGEILAAVEVPKPGAAARAVAYKVSKRRELDISSVSAGFYVELDANQKVSVIRLAYGGVAATIKRALHCEAALAGQPWEKATVEAAVAKLKQDFQPLTDHRGSSDYRLKLAGNLLLGFWLETQTSAQPELIAGHCSTVQTYEVGR